MTKTTELKRINRNLAKAINKRTKLLKKLEDQRAVMVARTDALAALDEKLAGFDIYLGSYPGR